jgi:hypothetical protein
LQTDTLKARHTTSRANPGYDADKQSGNFKRDAQNVKRRMSSAEHMVTNKENALWALSVPKKYGMAHEL